MSNKLKTKDDSTNKFLQRIAGKKALGPPPTPRPVIGEHPVRILIRENSGDDEKLEQKRLDKVTPLLDTPPQQLPIRAEQTQPEPQIGAATDSTLIARVTDHEVGGSEFFQKENLRFVPVEEKPSRRPSATENEKRTRNLKADEAESAAAPATAVSTFISDSPKSDLDSIRKKYRLNGGEFALYKELYIMSHAVGKMECSFLVSELMNATGMLERRVRDNIRRLKQSGWIVLVEAYNSESREKPKYRINTEPEL